MRKLSSIVARMLAVAGLTIIASTALPVAITAQPAPEHILVGASTDDVVRPLLYAVDAGLFKKAGLDVQLVKLPNGAAVAAAVAGGSIQPRQGQRAHAGPGLCQGHPIHRDGEPRRLFIAIAEHRDVVLKIARRFTDRKISSARPSAWSD